MEQRTIKVKKNWQVKDFISEREEHLFYRSIRTIVGAKYTPMACSSKINSENSVTFYVIATCEYITEPRVMQFVSVQYDVVDGLLQTPEIKVIGPEAVEFKLEI